MTALIYSPFPDAAVAEAVGRVLLAEGLVGCVNVGGAIRSIFRWGDEIGESQEVPALFKTDELMLPAAIARLEDLHPYEAPAIVGWRCEEAATATRMWLGRLAPD